MVVAKQEAGGQKLELGVEVARRLVDAFFTKDDTIAVPRVNVEHVVCGITPEVLRMLEQAHKDGVDETTKLALKPLKEQLRDPLRDPPLTDWQISRLIELIDANPHEEELGIARAVLSETLRIAKEQAPKGKRP